MSRVAIVTDSTAHLPPAVAVTQVEVVPLRVHLGPRTFVDGVDVTQEDVLAALRAKVPVSTSRPSPAQFAAVYRALLETGADHVVSVHLAGALSGTWESAVLAAQDFEHGVVRVVDSRGTAAALGFAVGAAASAAATGASAAQVQEAATADGRPHPHPALRRHPGVPAPRRADRHRRGAACHLARRQAVAADGRGPDRRAGEGAHAEPRAGPVGRARPWPPPARARST